MALVVFIRNHVVRLHCDSYHIGVHLKETYQIDKFLYSHVNIEDGRKKATSTVYYALLFQ